MSDREQVSERPNIEWVFDLLDSSRHLPAYQLERLAGVFFALFLPEVLEREALQVRRPLIPEFPIRMKDDKSSEKIDYFALSEDGERAFIIELKTDMNSIREKQIKSLKRMSCRDPLCLIKDVILLAGNRNKPTRQKYVHLLSHLRRLNLVCYDEEELYERAFAKNSKGVYEILEKSVVPASWICGDKPRLEVIYIQPIRKDGDSPEPIPSDWHRLYFDCFAETVEESGLIGRRFAESLRDWKEPAGSCCPRS